MHLMCIDGLNQSIPFYLFLLFSLMKKVTKKSRQDIPAAQARRHRYLAGPPRRAAMKFILNIDRVPSRVFIFKHL
jgi:hypothetical protein